MNSRDEPFLCSLECYLGIYLPRCFATREINTKITLSWALKWFVTRVHTLFSIYTTVTRCYHGEYATSSWKVQSSKGRSQQWLDNGLTVPRGSHLELLRVYIWGPWRGVTDHWVQGYIHVSGQPQGKNPSCKSIKSTESRHLLRSQLISCWLGRSENLINLRKKYTTCTLNIMLQHVILSGEHVKKVSDHWLLWWIYLDTWLT